MAFYVLIEHVLGTPIHACTSVRVHILKLDSEVCGCHVNYYTSTLIDYYN